MDTVLAQLSSATERLHKALFFLQVLYLILQCRSHRRKHRAALRAAGIPCDSNSNSYMERSTVDFIVPGKSMHDVLREAVKLLRKWRELHSIGIALLLLAQQVQVRSPATAKLF